MDELSLKRLRLLHPSLVDKAIATYEKAYKALTGRAKPRITYSLRTFKEQQDLYNLGRSVRNPDGYDAKKKPMGNIVTNAKPGQSIHNYGLAIDFALIIDGKTASWNTSTDWDNDKIADWKEVVNIFKADGWEWGGDWKTFKDEPHLQYDFGYSWQKLQSKYNVGNFVKGTNYVNIDRDSAPKNIYRTSASLNLRKGAATSFGVIMVLTKGEYVLETERRGDWSSVEYNGIKGWVNNKYLTK